MTLVLFLCLLVPSLLTIQAQDGTQKLKPKEVTGAILTQIKEIPSSEISKHVLTTEDKNKLVKSEKKIDVAEIIEIKPLESKITAQPVNSKPTYKKENKPKGKKSRSKNARKQKMNLRNKKRLRLNKLRKQWLNRRKQNQKRNKWVYKGKKQTRNIQPLKLKEVINQILSHHKKGRGSKLSSQHIRQQILDLMNDNKKVIKPNKNCPKPKIDKTKDRKRLRSLNRSKTLKKRPRKVVVIRGKQKVKVNKGKGKGKDVSKKITKIEVNQDGSSKTDVTKGMKGKKGSRRNKKTFLKQKGSKKN